MADKNENKVVPIPDGANQDKPKDESKKTNDNPGFFRKVGRAITAPGRYVYNKVKDSPAATAIGAVGGAAAALGGKVLIRLIINKLTGSDDTVEIEDNCETEVDGGPTEDYDE